MGDLQPWHIIVLLVILFLLFGAKKMPDMARSVGQSLRIFKSEMRQSQKETEEVAKQAGDAARVTPAVENSGSTTVTDAAPHKETNAG
jgi:sec-independent protein translocase protein TatA